MSHNASNNSFRKELQLLSEIMDLEFLEPDKFYLIDRILQKLFEFKDQDDFKAEFAKFRRKYTIINSDKTMQGLAFIKKHGYPGDYEIIDKIYTEFHADDKYLKQWDVYFHSQAAPMAVRNRKTYFKSLLNRVTSQKGFKDVTVLNLASGPCRDIKEYFDEGGNKGINFECVELDPNAIDYAKELLKPYLGRVKFINKNIFKFIPEKKYDLIWSAGLLDYFNDSAFCMILSRQIKFLELDGEIVIGNFSDSNPTAPYMEIIGEWYLNYRGESKLIELALLSGAENGNIRVMSEPEKVNLFLHITN